MNQTPRDHILVRTKTGGLVHLGSRGTRRSHCGVKAPFTLSGTIPSKRCCSVCFGPEPTNFNQYLEDGFSIV